mmetsp:Transcript_998/g.2155  ORF Transcript_998/g.2155 Transcript_998/m.2155 type:complete len:83 (-) Transcript_998:209-457(-)
MFQIFVSLYSWADQDKEESVNWEKTKGKFKNGFCEANRHCHWHLFYENWNNDFYGDQMKICNDIDETGCNGPPWKDDKYGYW